MQTINYYGKAAENLNNNNNIKQQRLFYTSDASTMFILIDLGYNPVNNPT